MIVQSVFVLILSSGATQGGITTAEFMGKLSCEHALSSVIAAMPYAKGVCVPKMLGADNAK